MTTPSLINFGRKAAILSFAGGILIAILYFLTGNFILTILGLVWICGAAIGNLIIVVQLVYRALKDQQNKRKLFRMAGLMLLNIPVAVIVSSFMYALIFTMRITIVNYTGQDISNVVVDGCDRHRFEQIKNGESKTVWVKAQGDCGVYMTYVQGETQKTERIVGYLTYGLGGKATYKIGSAASAKL